MWRRSSSAIALTLLVVSSMSLASGCAPISRTELVRMEDRIESLLELHTYEHIYRDLVYFGEERSFLFIKTVDRAVLFSIDISVRAGVDLADGVTVTADRRDPNRIYVRMPQARILSVDADESSIEEYFIRAQGGRTARGRWRSTQPVSDVSSWGCRGDRSSAADGKRLRGESCPHPPV